ncbi:MAG: maltose alpha-D-glucosyltransferase, partial [Dongiaceae bacterium]
MLTDDPLWFKDVVIYQLHVKSFFDANDDGVGDFLGLTQKLDYLQDLGINAIWLMPFYASPLRDDGYDIASYRNLHPSYGTMRQFRHFVREAHERGLRVITELVINHTSDQHPWFQRARRAKSGSKFRDWYVWSDNDQKYKGTRIIFTDTESSNWSWDPVAKSYYWHRFFAHQPDLNFDNPQVVRAVVSAMHFWIDAGVDGMRLDAIPYLCEREGTSNENLPETHAVLKRLRAALDGQHKNRMFLAEANQWPEDVQQYFGDGDECHMAYHFPLMPRMYMAIAQEDRHPITDIMRQTPEIPANCQWAVFLRNHDELTLEMVTDSERDYLWNTYAADRQARINLGIRRRLAPLMENDRRKIELMNSLLLSMPGTPIVYYGDEIGMGDNIFLGDRNGVRTPMQWTPDRNGGFSRTDPARLYLPPLMDPAYGYQAVNVEVQSRNSSSLLNWMKRLISARQAHQAFGRGTLTFLYPANRRILAYVREFGSEAILCVANLSRSAQVLELDLTAYKGRIPIELLGRVNFPPIGEAFYRLTMQGHSFLWFQLATAPDVEVGAAPPIDTLPEYVTLVMTDGIGSLLA